MSGWLIVIIGFLVVVLAVWQAYQLHQIRSKVNAVPQDGNVIAVLGSLSARVDSVEAELGVVDHRVLDLEGRLPKAISKVGTVTYDAFANIAGQLSRSIALLDEGGDGIVLSIMVSRDETMFFSKEIRGGTAREPLSPEEKDAIARALDR